MAGNHLPGQEGPDMPSGSLTLIAMLLDSVAPLVKMISRGSAPIRDATCCKSRREAEIRSISFLSKNRAVVITKTEVWSKKSSTAICQLLKDSSVPTRIRQRDIFNYIPDPINNNFGVFEKAFTEFLVCTGIISTNISLVLSDLIHPKILRSRNYYNLHFLLDMPPSLLDLSSPNRDQIQTPRSKSPEFYPLDSPQPPFST